MFPVKSNELISCFRKEIIVNEEAVKIVKPILVKNGVIQFVNIPFIGI